MPACAAMWFRCTTAESTISTATNVTTTCAWCLPRSFRSRNSTATPTTLFFLENGLKVYFGRQQALLDPQFVGTKMREEQRLRAATAADPKLAACASAWDDIAKIEHLRARLYVRNTALTSRAFRAGLLGDAVALVRAANERAQPNRERLPEYSDKALVNGQQQLTAAVPAYKDLDKLELTLVLTLIRRDLGADD